MNISSVLAGVPVSDMDTAREWWTSLLGRGPDRVPMPSDMEWSIAAGGGLQVIDDAGNAGAGSVTFGVDDVDAELATLASRGVDVPEAQTVPSGQFRIALLRDPDGNTVVLGQDLTDAQA